MVQKTEDTYQVSSISEKGWINCKLLLYTNWGSNLWIKIYSIGKVMVLESFRIVSEFTKR
jgi:hypothetical protein